MLWNGMQFLNFIRVDLSENSYTETVDSSQTRYMIEAKFTSTRNDFLSEQVEIDLVKKFRSSTWISSLLRMVMMIEMPL